MAMRLPRSLSPPSQLRAGEHCRDAGQIWIACPMCGRRAALDDAKHIVARGGVVTPAWKCTLCSFHDWIEVSEHP